MISDIKISYSPKVLQSHGLTALTVTKSKKPNENNHPRRFLF